MMKLLLDTNIFLEVILEQEKAQEARDLLSRAGEYEFFVSDYSIHSIGLLLFRREQHDVFRRFLVDMLLNVGVRLIALSAEEMEEVLLPARRFDLDFDGYCSDCHAEDVPSKSTQGKPVAEASPVRRGDPSPHRPDIVPNLLRDFLRDKTAQGDKPY